MAHTTKVVITIAVGLDSVEGSIEKTFDINPAIEKDAQTIGEELSDVVESATVDYILKSKHPI